MSLTDRITLPEAYCAMLHFLEGYYDRTQADEIAVLLGGLTLAGDFWRFE